MPSARNKELFEDYRQKAVAQNVVHFVGRLANYKYFNMNQAFKNVLDLFTELENPTHQ